MGSAAASCRRELISSFVKTLRRCHSTVRALMNSCAPISGFDRPSRARRAICCSCGVSSCAVVVALAHLLAGCDQLTAGAFSERLHADRCEHVVCSSQLFPCVHPPALSTKPLSIQQASTSKVRPESSAAQPLDRFSIVPLGHVTFTQQCAGSALPAPGRSRCRTVASLGQGARGLRGRGRSRRYARPPRRARATPTLPVFG